jgi:two-component system, OmpR family, response regulator
MGHAPTRMETAMIDRVGAESRSGMHIQPAVLRVVVVEDSRIIRERLAELLRDIPNVATLAYATTQDEALAILRQGEWEVVILDLQLKEGTGIRVLEELAKTTRRENTTVIVFSNFDFPQYRSRTIALGADFFFDKSLEFRRLHEVLAGLAGRMH